MTNYAAYNSWANKTLAEWLKTKPSEALFTEVPSSFSSIVKTFSHILAVQEFWQSVVAETKLSTNRYEQSEGITREIMNELIDHSEAFAGYVGSLSEEDLLTKVYLDTPWVKGEMPRYEFLQHIFNHSTYHRGQIITIGRNAGLTHAPITDYNYFNLL